MRRTETYREDRFRRQCLFSDFFLIFFSAVKSSEKEFKKRTKKLLRIVSLYVAFYPAFLAASQSAIQEKIILSPDTLWHSITNGKIGITEKSFLKTDLILASQNLPKNMRPFYQAEVGTGYNVATELGVVGFGIDFNYAVAAKEQTLGPGGALKAAFIWAHDDYPAEHYFDQSVAVLTGDTADHRSQGQPPFWGILSYHANILKKDPFAPENGDPIVRGNFAQARLEAYFSLKEWILCGDVALFTYKEESSLKPTFLPLLYEALDYTNFTLSRLPSLSGSLVGHFQVVATDELLARGRMTKLTQIEGGSYAYTVSVSWKHDFSVHFAIQPTYESTFEPDRTISGIALAGHYFF